MRRASQASHLDLQGDISAFAQLRRFGPMPSRALHIKDNNGVAWEYLPLARAEAQADAWWISVCPMPPPICDRFALLLIDPGHRLHVQSTNIPTNYTYLGLGSGR